jgi:hypothetical protein
MARKRKASGRPEAPQFQDVRADYLRTAGIPEAEITAILATGVRTCSGLEAAARAWLESTGGILLTAKHRGLPPAVAKRAAELLTGGKVDRRRRKADDKPQDGSPWSRPKGPKDWGKTFGISPDTFKRRCEAGTIRHKKLSCRKYLVHLDDIPTAVSTQAKSAQVGTSRHK